MAKMTPLLENILMKSSEMQEHIDGRKATKNNRVNVRIIVYEVTIGLFTHLLA